VLGSFAGEEKRIRVESFTVVLNVPLISNMLESGACSGKELMKNGFSSCLSVREVGSKE
jgi:hypothetical protein